MDELTDQDWRRLAQTVQRETCILLLGPDVAVSEQDPQHTPLTTLLSRSLAEDLEHDPQIVNPDDLRHVAQVYENKAENDHVDLELYVKDFYRPFQQQTTALHRRLADLPFSLCINTTHDTFMVNALKAAGKSPQVAHYNFRKPSPTTWFNPTPNSPVVFDLYGNIADEESLILTESDLLGFLVSVIKDTPPLPSYIKARFSAAETSFLFLGFGFQRWYVRILLHVLQAARHRYRSFALEEAGFFSHPERRQTAVFFERHHFIGFKLLSWESFVRELTARHATLAGSSAPAASFPADAPLAFLSHVHEDRDAAAALTEHLQRRGIRVWLDRQNLRGGDDWDRLIKDVIHKQVNYVVVVQSPRMQGQIESYVFKEIKLALEKQQQFAQNFRFVIPVQLEPCEPCEGLGHWHQVELYEPHGVEQLANAIREDWARRAPYSAAKVS